MKFFIGDLFGPLQRVRDKNNMIKIPMISKETWQTISYGISIESTVKFTKSSFSVKVPLLFKLHIRWSGTLLTWKNISTTCLSELANLKATVTHQKCTIISNFDFDPLRVELGPYSNFFDETNSKNWIAMCAIDWSLIGMKHFLYKTCFMFFWTNLK